MPLNEKRTLFPESSTPLEVLTPIPLRHNLLALEETYVDEGTVKVEHFKHISPDSESVFVLQLSFVVLPLRHLHSKLSVILTREEGIN